MLALRMIRASLFLAVLLCTNPIGLAQKLCPFRAPVGEAGLRKLKATKRVQPVYPKESLDKGVSGRVVVDILVDENGRVPEAKVNEAPDELTGQAVVDAAKQWEFKPPPKIQGRQICYSSTLSYRLIPKGEGSFRRSDLLKGSTAEGPQHVVIGPLPQLKPSHIAVALGRKSLFAFQSVLPLFPSPFRIVMLR